MKPYLSVIIPAKNEAKRLPTTLIDIDKHLSRADYSYEIIVVDNNSKDATGDIARHFSNMIKNMRVIEAKEPGKGGAVQVGMLEAKGTIRLFTDADNSTSIDQFEKMIPYFSTSGGKEGQYDVVIASRDVPGAKLVPPQPWYRRIGGDVGNLIIQALLLPGIWDTQCGFKAFTEEAAIKIFTNLKTSRWGFDVEVLTLAKYLGYKIKEIPIIWVNDPFSTVGMSAYMQVLWDVLRIKYWIMAGKYDIINSNLQNPDKK